MDQNRRLRYLPIIVFSFFVVASRTITEATSVGGFDEASFTKPHQFSPQVVFQCGFRNRYFSTDGKGEWKTDKDAHAGCLKGKLDILKYCRKVYPNLDITNIVESSHYYEISNWCKLEGQPCKWSFWVKPYRCIVGDFESEALLVPENCHFGHVDDRSECKDFDYWNRTAHDECSKRHSTPTVRSFAMLQPCGLDMFSGVEFVCCPRTIPLIRTTKADSSVEPKIDVKVKLGKNQQTDLTDDDEDYSDEDDDDDDEEDTEDQTNVDGSTKEIANVTPIPSDSKSRQSTIVSRRQKTTTKLLSSKKPTTRRPSTTVPTTTTDEGDEDDYSEDDDEDIEDPSTENVTANALADEQDPYFRIADPDREHAEYLAALDRLKKRHREKVAKVMKEWSDLEMRYQEMKEKDPNRGEQFRVEMTTRFQRTVSALEEENRDERHQIEEVHQQRVTAVLNERKRETMKAFRDALSASNPQAPKILRALQAYIRAEEKDRIHALNRYRHLLRTDSDAAATMKPDLLKKLKDIDLRINGTIETLGDVPEMEDKIRPAIMEFWQAFRDENTPKLVDDAVSPRGGDFSNDDHLLRSYKKEYQEKYNVLAEQKKANEAVDAKTLLNGGHPEGQSQPIILTSTEDKQVASSQLIDEPAIKKAEPLDDDDRSLLEQHEPDQRHSFALKETIQHDLAIKEEAVITMGRPSGGHYGYIVFGVAGITLIVAMLGGIMFIKRHFMVRNQGFIKVDHVTPEERHVVGMQVNGYENPTYKYFDDKA